MIEKMSKIEIVAIEENPELLLFEIQKTKVLHLEEAVFPTEKKLHFRRNHITPQIEKKIEVLNRLFLHIKHIFNQYNLPLPKEETIDFDIDIESLASYMRNLDKKITKMNRRKENLHNDLETLNKYIPARNALKNFLENTSISFDPFSPSGIIELPYKQSHYFEKIEQIIQRNTNNKSPYQIHKIKVNSSNPFYIVIFYTNKVVSYSILEDLWEEGFEEFNFPNRTSKMTLKQTLSEFDNFIDNSNNKELDISNKLKELLKENLDKLVKNYFSVQAMICRYKAICLTGRTDKTIIINGWIPESELKNFQQHFIKYNDNIIINELEIIHDEIDSIPTRHNNKNSYRDFEGILKLFPPATYGSFDPTLLNSITFPLFFGFMLGDVVYGIFVLFLAWLTQKKLPEELSFISTIIRWAGYSSIFFGILFWEFLGNFGDGLSPVSFLPILHRQHHIKECIAISLILGGIHVSIGFILGALKAMGANKIKKAIGEFAIVGFIWLLFILISSTKPFGIISPNFTAPALYGIIFLTITIAYCSGVFSVVELFSTISNILSYARLMAIGFSSVILAFVANTLGSGATNLFAGILIGIFIHSINIVLGIFGPALHSLRLHYVEFFPKFYDTDGIQYLPFDFNLRDDIL